MLNHLHFIASADDLSAVICSMKTFLSKEFKKNIQEYEANILKIFEKEGKYQFWENTNYTKLINSEKFLEEKINYIHFNPVKKLYVHYPEDWMWSSVSKIPSDIKIASLG